MSVFLNAVIILTAIMALYWVFWGQRKHYDLLNPKRKTELKAVLFDMDGVILDSFEVWHNVFNETRKRYGLKEISRKEFVKNVSGSSVDADVKNYFKGKSKEEITKSYMELIGKNYSKTKLFKDAMEVLEKIRGKKIKIGLVTNTFRKTTEDVLKFHKIKDYFDVVVTCDDVENPKPYPDSVLKACEKLSVMPDEVIYIGDTKNDYLAGKSAGCFFIGMNTKGDLIISELKDILTLI